MVAPVAGAVLGGVTGLIGGVLQRKSDTRFRRRQRAAINAARQFADDTVRRITEGELFSSAQSFLTSTFQDAAGSPLAEDFAKRIRAQQSVRGTFTGNLAAAQEAVGVSGFAQQLRQSLLPSAMQFATAPEQIRQSVLASEAPLRVAAATGSALPGLGPSNLSGIGDILGQSISGAFGGFQLGRQLQQDFAGQEAPQPQPSSIFQGLGMGGADFSEDALRRRIAAAGTVG